MTNNPQYWSASP